MLLNQKVVEQSVDRSDKGRFVKELLLVNGPTPLAIVRKRAATRHGDPGGTRGSVLLIHGYGQNRYAWHLPLRSVTNFLARAGYDVFNLELRGHGRSAHLGAKRPLSPADYVREDVPAAVEEVLAQTGGRPLFLLGHSLGGLVSYAAAPRLNGAIAGVSSIGSPYHFLRGARGLTALSHVVGFLEKRADLIAGDPALELRLAGEAVRVFRMFFDSPLYPLPFRGYYPPNIEPDVLAQHMSLAMDFGSIRVMRLMFRWARERAGRADVPGGVEGFGEAFEAMRDVPLLVIAGSEDDLAPPPGVRTAFDRSQAIDKTYRQVPAGHIDLLVGRSAPTTTWPILEAWLARRAPLVADRQVLATPSPADTSTLPQKTPAIGAARRSQWTSSRRATAHDSLHLAERVRPLASSLEDIMETNQEPKTDARPMKVLWMITERGDRSYWTKVGVGFVNKDGSVNLQLEAMPVGSAKLQLRDYSPRDVEAGAAPEGVRPLPGNGNGRAPRQNSGYAP